MAAAPTSEAESECDEVQMTNEMKQEEEEEEEEGAAKLSQIHDLERGSSSTRNRQEQYAAISQIRPQASGVSSRAQTEALEEEKAKLLVIKAARTAAFPTTWNMLLKQVPLNTNGGVLIGAGLASPCVDGASPYLP